MHIFRTYLDFKSKLVNIETCNTIRCKFDSSYSIMDNIKNQYVFLSLSYNKVRSCMSVVMPKTIFEYIFRNWHFAELFLIWIPINPWKSLTEHNMNLYCSGFFSQKMTARSEIMIEWSRFSCKLGALTISIFSFYQSTNILIKKANVHFEQQVFSAFKEFKAVLELWPCKKTFDWLQPTNYSL